MWRTVSAATLVATLVLGVASCGGDDDSSTATTAPSAGGTTPEERQVTDAEVTTGLKALPALVSTAVAAVGTGASETAFEPIEQSWESYEGTVRAKEPDLYLAIEDNFERLKQALGDGSKDEATKAQAAIEQAADDYLAKHP